MLPHDPSLRLKIRIGIHTGATTAGVVGKVEKITDFKTIIVCLVL